MQKANLPHKFIIQHCVVMLFTNMNATVSPLIGLVVFIRPPRKVAGGIVVRVAIKVTNDLTNASDECFSDKPVDVCMSKFIGAV